MPIDLAKLAAQIMRERGLEPEFSAEELQQLATINQPASSSSGYQDLSSLLWCSIDNDDSRDLDQLTYAERDSEQKVTLWIAIADVDALVKKGSAVDLHAQVNTTSVYTPNKIFPMLPEKLSTNLTSLNENEDRVALVVKIQINAKGDIQDSSIFQAIVRNQAQLAYSSVGPWLEGKKEPPEKVKKSEDLIKILKIQHETAQILKQQRHAAGSLTLESSEGEVRIDKDRMVIELSEHNFAHQLIEEFMIAANRVVAEHLNEAKIPSLRRVVRTPKYWDRIVKVAADLGYKLPGEPDSQALEEFLIKRKKADPDTFPDLSLTIIKLLGRGEYIVENDPKKPVGHFALAVSGYTHSTAPNRRYPDLITQRQYKAFLEGKTSPYSLDELYGLATHCSQQEDAATKVERQMTKSAAAMVLSSQIGVIFKGIVTGVGENGTWVRLFNPAVEGKIVQGFENLNVGDRVTVQLRFVNITKGFIDFVRLDH